MLSVPNGDKMAAVYYWIHLILHQR